MKTRAEIVNKEEREEQLEFIATLAHELKTPLTSIILSAGLLAEEIRGEGRHPQQELVQNIMRSAHNLESKLSEFLDAGKAGGRGRYEGPGYRG
jgi:signal transduction histidine kinase